MYPIDTIVAIQNFAIVGAVGVSCRSALMDAANLATDESHKRLCFACGQLIEGSFREIRLVGPDANFPFSQVFVCENCHHVVDDNREMFGGVIYDEMKPHLAMYRAQFMDARNPTTLDRSAIVDGERLRVLILFDTLNQST